MSLPPRSPAPARPVPITSPATSAPSGALRPLGTLSFDEAYDLFAEEVRAGVDAGVDLFIIETMTDLARSRRPSSPCRENSDLPVFATMTFEEDGRTFLGTSPEVAAITLDAIGADVLGINCSQGPAELRGLAARMLTVTDKPVMVQANAGLPRVDDDGNTVFDIQAPEYAEAVAGMIDDGVSVVGGCCGTTPTHMAALAHLHRQPHAQPAPPQAQHVGHERPDGRGPSLATATRSPSSASASIPPAKSACSRPCATATWTTS